MAAAVHTALHRAAAKGDLSALSECLHADSVIVNALDPSQRTALHRACRTGHAAIASALLAAGALQPGDSELCTPLHYAAAWGHSEIAARLLQTVDCVKDARDRAGKTALAWSCQEVRELGRFMPDAMSCW